MSTAIVLLPRHLSARLGDIGDLTPGPGGGGGTGHDPSPGLRPLSCRGAKAVGRALFPFTGRRVGHAILSGVTCKSSVGPILTAPTPLAFTATVAFTG